MSGLSTANIKSRGLALKFNQLPLAALLAAASGGGTIRAHDCVAPAHDAAFL